MNSFLHLYVPENVIAAFALSNTGIVGSNLTQGMDVYVCVVLRVGCGLATG
jgi:hypothetical protein